LADLTRFTPQALAGWVAAIVDSPIKAIARDVCKRMFMALSSGACPAAGGMPR
jgi:hypothetical protein